MSSIQVCQIKPNPAGKDRNSFGGASPTQLAAEWVDIKNSGQNSVPLDGIELNHVAYNANGDKKWESIRTLSGRLGAGQVLRVHSGKHRDGVISSEDLDGADLHVFTGSDNYVWNNRKGDCPALWNLASNSWIDKACYSDNPPEGAILTRSGDKLVPIGTARLNSSRW